MIDDRNLDDLLDRSAPYVDRAEAVGVAASAHRAALPARRSGRRIATLALVAGAVVGVGAAAAAVGGDSLATHLGWTADTAINRTASDGNACHLAFRAIPETGLIGRPPTAPDDPSVLAAQDYLRTLDVDSLEVTSAQIDFLKREHDEGDHQGPGEAAAYTEAYYENYAIFIAVVDAVKAELARQGLPADGVVTFEGANECTEAVLQP